MSIALTISYALLVGIIAASVYAIAFRPSVIKKVIALNVLSDAVCMLLIMLGYTEHGSWGPSAPLSYLSPPYADPLPQALVLTGIVIGMAVCIFASMLCYAVFKVFGTTDAAKIREALRGEAE